MTNPLDPKEPNEYCNGRKTDGSGYCQHEAGWGTDHPGVGRCKFHGGSTENYEKKIINELTEASEDASIAIRLQLKHLRKKLEDGEEVDVGDLDRLSRTVLDRTGYGPTEKREVDADVTSGGEPIMIISDESNQESE